MKAKSRKRLLISSVAMLLVAMLALGTATFAWFTQNKTAYADGINAKTTQASTLVLADHTRNGWSTHLQYSFNEQSMFPTSTIDGSTWYKAIADDPNSYNANNEGYSALAPTDDTNDYYFAEEFNIKNEGSAAVEGVTITVTNLNTSANNYFYFALLPITIDPDTSDETVATFSSGIYSYGADSYKNLVNNSGTIEEATSGTYTSTAVFNTSTSTNVPINVGDMAAGEIKYYKLYCWFEGQDTDCTTAKSGEAISGLTFTVSPATT